MQAVGMLRGTGAVYFLVILTTLVGHARLLPLQILPSIPGYIPVYIRHGDEPLIDINPALAEAFHEDLAVPKSLPLDNTADDPGMVEDLPEKSRENIPEDHSATENETRITENEETEEYVEKKIHGGLTKILPLQQLGGNHYRREHQGRGGSVPKEAVVKVSPLSNEEKEELDRFRIRIEKQETSEESATKVEERTTVDRSKLSRDFAPVISVGDKDLPRIRLTHAAEESSSNRSSQKMRKPMKLQPEIPPSNVRKILPVKTEETTIGSSDKPKDNDA